MIATGLVPVRAAPPAGASGAPQAAVKGFRVELERLTQTQSLSVEFPEMGAPRPSTNRQYVTVQLAVHAPNPKLAQGIHGLTGPVRVSTDRGENLSTGGTTGRAVAQRLGEGRVWRGTLSLPSLDARTAVLRHLEGEVLVYPRTEQVRLEWSLKDKLPATREQAGYKVTLTEATQMQRQTNVVIRAEWPKDVAIAASNEGRAFGVSALTARGAQLPPVGYSSGSPTQSNGINVAEYRVSFYQREGEGEPAKVQIEALVRSGEPVRLPFRIANVELPTTVADREAPDPEVAASDPDFPFMARDKGATLQTSVRREQVAIGRGELLVGFSRKVAAGWSAWRWLAVSTDAQGRATVKNLLPGEYRVRRLWKPASDAPDRPQLLVQLRAGQWQNAAGEVTLTAGQAATLPALEWRPAK